MRFASWPSSSLLQRRAAPARTSRSAATAVVPILGSAARLPEPELRFPVDRPFLFFITERSAGAILFQARVMTQGQVKRLAPIGCVILVSALFGDAQALDRTSVPQRGAADKPDGPWPYPEPAVRGATGYGPDYTRFKAPDEQKDIQVLLLWRATDPKGRRDRPGPFYLEEYRRFMSEGLGERRSEAVAQSVDTFVRLIGDPIRKGMRKPPFFDDKFTGCWLFFVSRPSPVASRERTRDLHAGNCR